jgi:glutathione S-transferase
VPHREPGHDFLITGQWTDPAATEENIEWTRSTYAALEPHLGDRRYINYLDKDEGADAARAAFGPNYDRLVEVKTKYDPDNFFRQSNQSIEPAASS